MSVEVPDQKPAFAPKDLESLQAYLASPESVSETREHAAKMLKENLESYGVGRSIEPLGMDTELMEMLIDRQAVTILVDSYYGFAGSDTLGLVSLNDGTSVNVIYSPLASVDSSIGEYDDGTHSMLIKGGSIVTPSGHVVYGPFAKPLTADLLITSDIVAMKQAETLGVPIVQKVEDELLSLNKQHLSALFADTQLLAARYTDDALTQTTDLVIKPSRQQRGLGVLIGGDDTSSEELQKHYNFLADMNQEPLIEERIKSWPIHDPETGHRLDWNVRALIGNQKLLGMYIRADEWGRPVNKSLGARAILMHQLDTYASDTTYSAELQAILEEAGTQLAQNIPYGFGSLDLTVDEGGNARLFEINGARSGGVQTLARYEQNIEGKLRVPKQLIQQWAGISPNADDSRALIAEQRVKTGLSSMIFAADAMKRKLFLPELTYDATVLEETNDQLAHYRILFEKAMDARKTFDISAYKTLFQTFPMEVADDLFMLTVNIRTLEDSRTFEALAQTYLLPNEERDIHLAAFTAGRSFNIVALQEYANQLEAIGGNIDLFDSFASAPIIVDVMWMMTEKTFEEKSDLMKRLKNSYVAIIHNDVPLESLFALSEKTEDATEKSIYKALQLKHLVATNEFDAAYAYILAHTGDEEVMEATYETVFNVFNIDLMKTREGFRFYASVLAMQEQYVPAIDVAMDWLRSNPDEEVEEILHTAISGAPWITSAAELQIVAEVLADTVSVIRSNDLNRYPSPIKESFVERSDAVAFAWIIQHLWTGMQHPDALTLFERLKQNEAYASDLEYLSDQWHSLFKDSEAASGIAENS
jgi:hypothetical protein